MAHTAATADIDEENVEKDFHQLPKRQGWRTFERIFK